METTYSTPNQITMNTLINATNTNDIIALLSVQDIKRILMDINLPVVTEDINVLRQILIGGVLLEKDGRRSENDETPEVMRGEDDGNDTREYDHFRVNFSNTEIPISCASQSIVTGVVINTLPQTFHGTNNVNTVWTSSPVSSRPITSVIRPNLIVTTMYPQNTASGFVNTRVTLPRPHFTLGDTTESYFDTRQFQTIPNSPTYNSRNDDYVENQRAPNQYSNWVPTTIYDTPHYPYHNHISHVPQSRSNINIFDRVKSWNTQFSGAPNDNVETFLRKVHKCQKACNMTDEELFSVLPVMLSEIAENWWERRQNSFENFYAFKQALLRRFGNVQNTRSKLISDIVLRTQGDLESGADFLDNCRLMWEHARDGNFSEAARLDMAFNNLRPEYHEFISREDFGSFDGLEDLLLNFDNKRKRTPLRSPPLPQDMTFPDCAYKPSRYENSRNKNKNKFNKKTVQQLYEVAAANATEKVSKNNKTNVQKEESPRKTNNVSKGKVAGKSEDQVAAVNNYSAQSRTKDVPNTDTENSICFNCDGKGHTYPRCKLDRKIFCYGCGKKDTKKPSCPNCKNTYKNSGNRTRTQ